MKLGDLKKALEGVDNNVEINIFDRQFGEIYPLDLVLSVEDNQIVISDGTFSDEYNKFRYRDDRFEVRMFENPIILAKEIIS